LTHFEDWTCVQVSSVVTTFNHGVCFFPPTPVDAGPEPAIDANREAANPGEASSDAGPDASSDASQPAADSPQPPGD
jgi:hypothetical protein